MKSIKLSLLVLFGTMLFTCQKGKIVANIDLTGEWELRYEDFDCPCYMIYLKRDTTCYQLKFGPLDNTLKLFEYNDSLFFEYDDIPTKRVCNLQASARTYKRGEKLMFFKNTALDPYNTPPRYASTEATIVNENLINFKIYYYDNVEKTGTYGLIRFTGVQEVNLRRIKKK